MLEELFEELIKKQMGKKNEADEYGDYAKKVKKSLVDALIDLKDKAPQDPKVEMEALIGGVGRFSSVQLGRLLAARFMMQYPDETEDHKRAHRVIGNLFGVWQTDFLDSFYETIEYMKNQEDED